MKFLKGILIVLLFILVLASLLAFQVGLIAGGAWLALVVAGWFGWFAGVGWSTYFAVGVCLWAFTIVTNLPTLGKRRFVNKMYAEYRAEVREQCKKAVKDSDFDKAFENLVKASWKTYNKS